MGEIADMMLDGTMDCETGEWNFDGEDGPGYPMTGAEAARYRRETGWRGSGPSIPVKPVFAVTKKLRAKIEKHGVLVNHNAYHWTVRENNGAVIAHWYPHKRKWRISEKNATGDETAFIAALAAKQSAGDA